MLQQHFDRRMSRHGLRNYLEALELGGEHPPKLVDRAVESDAMGLQIDPSGKLAITGIMKRPLHLTQEGSLTKLPPPVYEARSHRVDHLGSLPIATVEELWGYNSRGSRVRLQK